MGRFSWSVLALLAACGDNSSSSSGEPVDGVTVDDGPQPSDSMASARYVPTVCGATSWTTNIAGDVAMNVSVTGRAHGATLLSVPVGGGAMTGFVLDNHMDMPSGVQKLAIDQVFENVSVTPADDRVVATAVSNGSVYLNLFDTELGNPQQVAKLPGTQLAEPSFFNAQHDFVMPVGGEDGLTLHRFNHAWEYIDSNLVMKTAPATAMTAAQLGVFTMTAWSTADDCFMMQVKTFDGGPKAHTGYACPSPRLAMSSDTGAGAMVFDSPEGVRLMHTQDTQMAGASTVMRAGTSSPRVVFDGARFWISVLDARGDVIVGYLDPSNQFVSMSLAGPNPQGQAYELAMVGGAPWVFALDENGYSAYRMCLDAQ